MDTACTIIWSLSRLIEVLVVCVICSCEFHYCFVYSTFAVYYYGQFSRFPCVMCVSFSKEPGVWLVGRLDMTPDNFCPNQPDGGAVITILTFWPITFET